MKIALAQITSNTSSLEENIDKHLEFIAKAKQKKSDVVVFPELSLHGHHAGNLIVNSTDNYETILNRKAINKIRGYSQGITVMAGGLEITNSGLVYNSFYAIRDEKIIFKHRKINIPTYGNLDEGKYYGRGTKLKAFHPIKAKHTKSVILTCADSWNPPLVYIAALQGANIIFIPKSSAINATHSKMDNSIGWNINTLHTAMTYGLYVIKVNRVGSENGLDFYGNSVAVDPYGNIVAEAGEDEELVTADIDFNKVLHAKITLPTIRDANLLLINRFIKKQAKKLT